MPKTKLSEHYQKSLEQQWSMRFSTCHPNNDKYHGVITQTTKRFVALQCLSNFEWDGTVVFPKRSIIRARDGKFEACQNAILRQTGAMDHFAPIEWLASCETIQDVFIELKERDIWPGVELMYPKNQGGGFYIGPITKVSKDSFSLWCYDAAGKWEKEYIRSFKNVFRVEIESRYISPFNAYMRRNNPLSSITSLS